MKRLLDMTIDKSWVVLDTIGRQGLSVSKEIPYITH